MEMSNICKVEEWLKPKNFNHKFYSILKPTIFVLRFIGGPTGLWRLSTERSNFGQKLTTFSALFMLIVINMGAIGDLASTYQTICKPDRKFEDNINLIHALVLNIYCALALDIFWWRRKLLRDLLYSIDFEPKICEKFDTECQKINEKEINEKSIKIFLFMLTFIVYTIYFVFMSTERGNEDMKSINFHLENTLLGIRCLSVLLFAIILSFYISLSWVFRLKVSRINRHLKNRLIRDARNGINPSECQTKLIELWFTSYIIDFKKFEIIFKQIAGTFYIIMIWSVLSLAEESITNIMSNIWHGSQIESLFHEALSISLLAYFLYSVSIVEHYFIKLVKLLYHLSLIVRFSSDSIENFNKSGKVCL